MGKPAWIKYWLTRVGEQMPPSAAASLKDVHNYLEVGNWMREQGYEIHRVNGRQPLFEMIAQQVADREVLYLEFGVWRGDTTRAWSKLLRNPKSNIHGFDSFEGLPEAWDQKMQKGTFSTEGQIPQIDDPRVKFFKGWFEQSLPNYQLPPHEVLVVNMDADLYSSTIYVLNHLKDAIVPGTYLYFDEFHDGRHEFRAFNEFRLATGMKFKLIGANRILDHVVFQRTA